ncbi:MAG: hypothetical protein AAFQ63_05015 [Cyanobacteria bacterium J06621_11]
MDEQPVPLHKETREPIEATAKHAKRVDYDYERARTASIFIFTEPAAGWQQATVRARRTQTDWAAEVVSLMEGRYAGCQRVRLGGDNLTWDALSQGIDNNRDNPLIAQLKVG